MSKYTDEILNIISTPGEHLTAEQIFFRLREVYPTVALATVYNNLKTLLAAGQIRSIAVDGLPDRYDGVVPHDHLLCRRCGKLIDVSSDRLDAVIRQFSEQLAQEQELEIEAYDLKLLCICRDCRDSKK